MVGAASDPAEREADRVARDVMRRLRVGSADADRPVSASDSRVRRSAVIGAAGGPVDAAVETRIRAARSGGSPLPDTLGRRLETAFGADFSGVRIHSGREAADLNETMQARAFTTRSDIFLGRGAPSLRSDAGTQLLAHELTHVVQQTGAAQRSTIRRVFIHGSADEDAELFDKVRPVDAPIDVGPTSRAAHFGITATNMPHYLERHSFMYQRLNAKTVSPAAGMFPYKTAGHKTNAADVRAMLQEALAALPDGTNITAAPVSQTVDLSNGLRVNVGALKSGKLSAFFPIDGGSNNGYHKYTADELRAIRTAKNAALAPVSGGST